MGVRRLDTRRTEHGGHKSLYSEAFYSREQFGQLYGGELPEQMKQKYDPDRRFPDLYDKTVNNA